jgi:hypothetical protein
MFRRFFRIGFGGCGCALEEHFRGHAVELARELLLKCYVEKLNKWKDVLSLDKFEMEYVGGLKGNLKESMFNDEAFNDKLEEIKKQLDSWNGSLRIAKESTGMSYEEDIVEALSSIITEMGTEVDKIEKKGSILLESLPVDSYTGPEKKRIYAYNQDITETRDLIVDQYEHAIIESEGFNHQPKISKDNLLQEASGGYLFFVGLGGGTGTGVISPLAERFGKGSFGYFTLGVLGGVGDNEKIGSQQPWFRRCFNMLLALNDLLVTAELDGIILVDNDIIIKRLSERGIGVNKASIDREIIEALYPAFGITALENGKNELDWAQLRGPIGLHELEKKPPVIVPCYASASGDKNLEGLIDDALTNGMLTNCKYKNDKGGCIVEKVFVYTRCIEDEYALEEKLRELFGKKEDIAIIKEYLFCWDDIAKENYKEFRRFVGDYYGITWANAATASTDKLVNTLKISKNSDVYIEIQTDYLFNWDSVLKGENKEELESYLRDGLKIEWAGRLNPKISKDKKTISIVKDNENKVEITLDDDDKKATLTRSEGESLDLQVKRKKDNRIIYQPSKAKLIYSKKKDNPTDIDVKTVNDKDYIYLKGCPATRDWLLRKLKNKKVVVFESQEIGTYWKVRALIEKSKEDGKEPDLELIRNFKKNEVLMLLVNPDIRDALSERLRVARNFVWLLDSLKTLIDEETAGSKLEKANEIVKGEDLEIHQRHLFSIDPNFELNGGNISEKLKEEFKRHGFSLPDGSSVGEGAKEMEWKITVKEEETFIIKEEAGKLNIYYPILANLPQHDITEEEKKPLAQARNFLLPKELIEKNENIYEHMKEILEKKLMDEAVNACLNLKEGKWPIFKEKIFDITSISGKRDEVIVSSISAMNTDTKKTFDSLVGDAYNPYFDTFQRQFFKYNMSYLYPGGTGADSILSDEAEDRFLPEELKDIIDKSSEPVKGETLENLVRDYIIKNVYVPAKISFPTMLALAGLYSKWRYLFSWDKNENASINKEELMKELFGGGVESNDFEICPLFSIDPKFENELNNGNISDELKEEFTRHCFSLPDNSTVEENGEAIKINENFIIRKEEGKLNMYSEKKINLIINEKNEDATLIIRRSGSPLFTWKAGEDEYINLDEEIPKGLKDEFKNELKVELKVDKMSKEEEQWWKIPYETSYYYIQQVNSKELEIYGDELHKLKVKKAEESGKFKFKIYKRRGEMF